MLSNTHTQYEPRWRAEHENNHSKEWLGRGAMKMLKNIKNKFRLEIDSKKENEALLLDVVSAFVSSVNPQPEDISDLRMAVFEAFTNARLYAYPNYIGKILVTGQLQEDETNATVAITVKDYGVGIENLNEAMTPLFSTSDASGLGFTVMDTFASVKVKSEPYKGTTVTLTKLLTKKLPKEAF